MATPEGAIGSDRQARDGSTVRSPDVALTRLEFLGCDSEGSVYGV